MRNEWKELEINNLPPDILTGDYEWEVLNDGKWCASKERRDRNIYSFLEWCSNCNLLYRYRKPEPKQPTHEEIISKWWRSGEEWYKVISYNRDTNIYLLHYGKVNRIWFDNMESADIPPELEC
jgi:hypothetical protein